MSAKFRPRRHGINFTPTKANVRPTRKPVDPMTKGLPANPDAERFVLGSVLLNDAVYPQVAAALEPGDFSLDKHRRIFAWMKDLNKRGEHRDRITLANEMAKQRQLESIDGLSYLISLDEGMPEIAHLDSYIRIVKDKAALRKAIFSAQMLMSDCLLQTAAPEEILNNHLTQIEELRAACGTDRPEIRRVEELESIFARRAPLEYLVRPELPAKAIVCLTGDSESGKTTLACAWAREVFRRGHAVLLLDRDKNPRDRIHDRLARLGIDSDGEMLRIWDCEQDEEPPQPDHPIIADWVKRMMAETGKSVLVIVDSLVSFFTEEEDENSAVDMRAVFDRCRTLTKLGGTVILIHHTNRNGEARGSSDFKPASDQAFLVSNCDRGGGRLLDVITLSCEKSRYGLSGNLRYHYAGGQMLRVEDHAPVNTVSEQLVELLTANPGVLTDLFEDLAQARGLGRNKARKFLKDGATDGTIRVEAEGRKRRHFWRAADGGRDDLSPQGNLCSKGTAR
jgi:KaiC/GvpD/RAD55 family RecA-like ATPase